MEKIAIRGDKNNAHKIIEYFESLGASNYHNFKASIRACYYIDMLNNNIEASMGKPAGYTLFESWPEFKKKYLNKNKMEKRNIEISLEKAKEWYKQGGDLKEVALQAFSEDELKYELENKFPSSWDEYNIKADWEMDRINAGGLPGSANYCHFATKEEAEAFVALGKLIQLRDKYWKLDDNWKPTWNYYAIKYTIGVEKNKITLDDFHNYYSQILSFRTKEIRDKFYENFKDLIEEAKMFL